MNPHEYQYQRTGRVLAILFILFLPVVGLVGFGLGRLLGASWPLFVSAGVWMGVMIVVSVLRFVAYYRWTGKYPFFWLR